MSAASVICRCDWPLSPMATSRLPDSLTDSLADRLVDLGARRVYNHPLT